MNARDTLRPGLGTGSQDNPEPLYAIGVSSDG